MFTGIVEAIGRVERITSKTVAIRASMIIDGLKLGDSIAVNGTCLTVKDINKASFAVNVVPETLRLTNLGSLKIGDHVNLERPLPVNGRLDGHLVQGHVDGKGIIECITHDTNALTININASSSIMRYIVRKGFVTVDGVSLTVVNCDDTGFSVTIIPYTKDNTVFYLRQTGDIVNLEVDIIAKYLERLVENDQL